MLLFSDSQVCCLPPIAQVVQVCAEHKKPRKLVAHLQKARSAAGAARNPPRCLVRTA